MSFVYPITTEKKSLQKVSTQTFQNENMFLTFPLTANGPLNVFFKLSITEIISVDDHRRVRKISELVLNQIHVQEVSILLGYNMRWPEHRMVLNESADWSRGEIMVSPEIIEHFWVPDVGIHDLVR